MNAVCFVMSAVLLTGFVFHFVFSVLDLSLCPDEQILNGNQPDMDDGVGCENLDEDAVAMVEETQSGFDIVYTTDYLVHLWLIFIFMLYLNKVCKGHASVCVF